MLTVLAFLMCFNPHPGQNVFHLSRRHFQMNEKLCISIQILLKIFLMIQLAISRHWFWWWLCAEKATSHHLNQCVPSLPKHICGTTGRWDFKAMGAYSLSECVRKENVLQGQNAFRHIWRERNRWFPIDYRVSKQGKRRGPQRTPYRRAEGHCLGLPDDGGGAFVLVSWKVYVVIDFYQLGHGLISYFPWKFDGLVQHYNIAIADALETL